MENQNDTDITHNLKEILSPGFTFTKRQLGWILFVAGALAFIAILGLDVVGGGREGGIGPAQMAALVVTAFVALIGLTLVPLGDDPA